MEVWVGVKGRGSVSVARGRSEGAREREVIARLESVVRCVLCPVGRVLFCVLCMITVFNGGEFECSGATECAKKRR